MGLGGISIWQLLIILAIIVMLFGTSIEYAGSHNGEATYELSLASAGALTFTAL